jgi:hypothetical protein
MAESIRVGSNSHATRARFERSDHQFQLSAVRGNVIRKFTDRISAEIRLRREPARRRGKPHLPRPVTAGAGPHFVTPRRTRRVRGGFRLRGESRRSQGSPTQPDSGRFSGYTEPKGVTVRGGFTFAGSQGRHDRCPSAAPPAAQDRSRSRHIDHTVPPATAWLETYRPRRRTPSIRAALK